MQSQQGFAPKLIEWYNFNKRDLPWRNTQDPFKIWMSEIILQQTRVQQGLPYYERFVAAFASVTDLANAPLDDVLRLWQGLGYYSRARNMHQAATYIRDDLAGIFPNSFENLLQMKGVGRYTAAAIASFAYNEQVPVVDGNVQRLLARIFGVSDDIMHPKTQKIFETIANQHIPKENPGIFNQAIMEFGSLYCTPSKPDCESCIFNSICFAHKHQMASELPVKLKKTKVRKRFFQYAIFRNSGRLALGQRLHKDIWNGLFEFYLVESDTELTDDQMNQQLEAEGLTHFKLVNVSDSRTHILSHQRLATKFYIYQIENSEMLEKKGLSFYNEVEVENLAKPVLLVNYLEQEKLF